MKINNSIHLENMTKEEKQLIYTLVRAGTKNLRISKKQEMKLNEWIIAYLLDEIELSGQGPMLIEKIRILIDRWENPELNENDYKYYYVDKNTDGKSPRDLLGL